MGIEIFDSQIHNVAILSEQQALADIEGEYIADPFAHRLIARASFLGWTFTWLYYIFEFFGWCYAYQNMVTVLKTAQIGLEMLKSYLIDPQPEPSFPVSAFLSLSFDEQWQKRLRGVCRLFGHETAFPSFEKAQRVAAPIILQEITRAPIPWDLFDALLNQKKLDGPAQRRLKEWIDDVNLWGAYISPFLLLSVCEAAAHRYFPRDTAGRQGAYTFFLAWTLYKAGLSELSSPEIYATEESRGVISSSGEDEEVQFGAPIPILFPSSLPISAHEVQEHPGLMVLTSPSPLLLGMWIYNVNECPSVIPSVATVHCDRRGRYVIVERLSSTLEEPIWNGDGCIASHDRALLDVIADLGRTILRFSCTLDLELSHIFLTSELRIRTMAPLQERYPYFCLPIVEQFLREICHEDQERIRLLFHSIEIWRHPASQMYRSLLEKFSFDATDPDIHRELMVFDIDDRNFQYVADWVRALRRHVSRIREQLKGLLPFASLSFREQTAQIVAAVLRSQEEIGWISSIPTNLPDLVIASMYGEGALKRLAAILAERQVV